MSEESRSKAVVLLADDMAFFRRYLGDLLREAGYEVIEAADGAELLARLDENEHRVSLVLSDVVMPKGNAFGLLPIIRKKHTRYELPVLVLSDLAGLEDIQRLRELGADGFISKQAPPVQILCRVRRALWRRPPDRRESRRGLADVPLRYVGEVHEGYGRLFDLSQLGLYVESAAELPPVNTRLTLSFVLPGQRSELELCGTVVRLVPAVAKPLAAGVPPGFGVRLEDVDEASLDAIVAYLDAESWQTG